MQGFIIKLNRAREEDMIVSIIAEESLQTLYRFYGARHSPINMGFKIDYEAEYSLKSSIPRMKDVIHLGFSWMGEYERLRLWQQFIALFHPHLKDSESIGNFYFDLLNDASARWKDQNPKRVAIESYIRILDHEGRLHRELNCFFCDLPIENDISLIRAFLPAHQNCSHTLSINPKGFEWLYTRASTLFLDDNEVERLWYVLNEGL
ncbi:putative recombination protein RecO [Sulfuricurvum kujiense DSM 16994]|uniref:Recombination protein RecO n=1 Tax=Sulfuricurvum kujiense (strain ATCC BAA-921 / DSM 16994 / JCM 11577 / YK-1) TaxID=709032 RepID=E4TWH0_SULKY|nr:recombination protein RecO [Sulfuricurvum kujiense]ADR33788.1 putative recombination protein RecO [Sulfuricurvum kujiense DSM 16994]